MKATLDTDRDGLPLACVEYENRGKPATQFLTAAAVFTRLSDGQVFIGNTAGNAGLREPGTEQEKALVDALTRKPPLSAPSPAPSPAVATREPPSAPPPAASPPPTPEKTAAKPARTRRGARSKP